MRNRPIKLETHELVELIAGFVVLLVSFAWLFAGRPLIVCVLGMAAGALILSLGVGAGSRERPALPSVHLQLDSVAIGLLAVTTLTALIAGLPGTTVFYLVALGIEIGLRAGTSYATQPRRH